MKKGLSLLLVLVMVMSLAPLCEIIASSATVDDFSTVGSNDPTVYSQLGISEKYWGNDSYELSGCGVFAIVNAVKYLNGKKIPWRDLGNYSKSHKYQGSFDLLIQSAKNDNFGKQYGYQLDEMYYFGSNSRKMECRIGKQKISVGYPSQSEFDKVYSKLVSHLKQGHVAVVLVLGHFMAIVDYDEKTDKFLILDSAATTKKKINSKFGKVAMGNKRPVKL